MLLSLVDQVANPETSRIERPAELLVWAKH
jgi:hypothetical protein